MSQLFLNAPQTVASSQRPTQQPSEKIRKSLQIRDTNTPFLLIPALLSVCLCLLRCHLCTDWEGGVQWCKIKIIHTNRATVRSLFLKCKEEEAHVLVCDVTRQSDRRSSIWLEEWRSVKWQLVEGDQWLQTLETLTVCKYTEWCVGVMDRWRAALRSWALKLLFTLISQHCKKSGSIRNSVVNLTLSAPGVSLRYYCWATASSLATVQINCSSWVQTVQCRPADSFCLHNPQCSLASRTSLWNQKRFFFSQFFSHCIVLVKTCKHTLIGKIGGFTCFFMPAPPEKPSREEYLHVCDAGNCCRVRLHVFWKRDDTWFPRRIDTSKWSPPPSSSSTQLEPMNRGGSNKSHFLSLVNDLILPPDCSPNLQVISFASNNSLFLIVWNGRM